MRGWHLFTISGIDIEVNYSWLFIFALLIMGLGGEMRLLAPEVPSWQPVLAGTIGAILLFASVLLHELAHSFAARWYGLGIARITLFIFGGVAQTRGEARTGASEMVIAAIGPVSSLALAGLFLGLGIGLNHLLPNPLPAALAHRVGIVNVYLAVFNLLPAFPLDGGRLLRASLWEWWGDLTRSTRLATTLGRLFGYLLMGLGLYYMFARTALDGIWFLGLGWLLMRAAVQSWQSLQVRDALSVLTAGQAMRPLPAALNPNASVLAAVEQYLIPFQLELMPVAEEGRVIGVLGGAQLRSFPQQVWAQLPVRQAMAPFDPQLMLLPASVGLGEALETMAGNERQAMFVTSAEGALAGLLTQQDIVRAAQLLAPLNA